MEGKIGYAYRMTTFYDELLKVCEAGEAALLLVEDSLGKADAERAVSAYLLLYRIEEILDSGRGFMTHDLSVFAAEQEKLREINKRMDRIRAELHRVYGRLDAALLSRYLEHTGNVAIMNAKRAKDGEPFGRM